MKDIQNLEDTREVDIQKVGIKHIEMPLTIQRKNNSNQIVYAKARVNVTIKVQKSLMAAICMG